MTYTYNCMLCATELGHIMAALIGTCSYYTCIICTYLLARFFNLHCTCTCIYEKTQERNKHKCFAVYVEGRGSGVSDGYTDYRYN